MESLNKSSLDVWEEHLKDENRKKISDRILILDSLHELTEKEQQELKTLLNLEKKLLSDCEILTDINKRAVKKFNYYKNKLDNDERLSIIFLERINIGLNEEKTYTEDDITKVYIQMMEEDMDVTGHQKLNEHYDKIILDVEEGNSELICTNPNCVYCKEITKEEYGEAFDELKKNGYLDNGIREQDKLMELMVIVCRLEDELEKHTKNYGCDIVDISDHEVDDIHDDENVEE